MSAIDATSFLSLIEVFPALMEEIPRESRLIKQSGEAKPTKEFNPIPNIFLFSDSEKFLKIFHFVNFFSGFIFKTKIFLPLFFRKTKEISSRNSFFQVMTDLFFSFLINFLQFCLLPSFYPN